MLRNEHKPGNMAVLVQAPRTGLRTFEDALWGMPNGLIFMPGRSLALARMPFLSG